MYFACVAFEGEHASAAGQVPLLDGRIRRAGEDVPVVDERARDVTLVASYVKNFMLIGFLFI